MPFTRPVIGLLTAAACSALAVAAVSASARAQVDAAPAPGAISVVAGGAGGPGLATTVALSNTSAQARNCGVSYAGGSLYIGDSASVRAVSPGSDRLTTPAGAGATGPLGNTGPAARAALLGACGAVLDHAGNLVIADGGDNQVRVVAGTTGAFHGQAMTAGDIYTLGASGTTFPANGVPAVKAGFDALGLAVTAAGNLQVSDLPANRILQIGG